MDANEGRFTVGWIAPMPLELIPAICILEQYESVIKDETLYYVGRIGFHWVVMVVCPRIGTHHATVALRKMTHSFPNIKHVLVVGIAGGVPQYGPSLQHQIVLGDVVVSYPVEREGGVAHIDFGGWQSETDFNHSGHTLHPSDALLSAVNNLRSQHGTSGTLIPTYLDQLRMRIVDGERPEYQDPGPDWDFYFPDAYHHTDKDRLCEWLCEFKYATWRRVRGDAARRATDTPCIHYGTIASSNALIVSSAKRNELYRKHKAICFEMESAGIVCNTQALVIRGICDYADAHKNKTWQKYAAATAVAYAKELLLILPPPITSTEPPKNRQPSSQSILECQKSLAFLNMDNRAHDVSAAAEGTCQWLINHVNYKRWAVAHRGLLWIKGKPGSGKSTLLKYAFKHLDRPQDIVLSFFFHGRGSDMQRTPLGFLRAIFHQVLQQAPESASDLVSEFENKCKEIGKAEDKWEWHLKELKSFFESSLQEMFRARTVWLFVDALDEAGKENAKSIFRWLKSLVKISPSAGGQVRICVTCRHFPILDTTCEFGICPEEENYEDISRYIRDRLSDYFNIFKSRIPSIITDRAAGVFMWARLVIDKVVDLELEGETMMAIEAAIYEIPLDLDLLYRDLIRDMKPNSRTLIEWTLLAEEPLSLFDLRWAILVDAHHPYRSLRECYNSGAFIQGDERMKRQICTLSRGLVETNCALEFQFIHQTVKDFFLEGGLAILRDTPSIDIAIGTAHLELSLICLNYIAMEEIMIATWTRRDIINSPFLRYAVESWTWHLKESDIRDVDQQNFLNAIDRMPGKFFNQWDTMTCILIDGANYLATSGTTLAHVLSREGRARLLKSIVESGKWQNESFLNAKDGDGWTAFDLAINGGHDAIIDLLLNSGQIGINMVDKHGMAPLSQAVATADSFRSQKVVKLLLATDQIDINVKDSEGNTPLFLAARRGNEAAVELLFATGQADVDMENYNGETPLVAAAHSGKERLFKLMVAKSRSGMQWDHKYSQNLLLAAVEGGSEAIIKLVLDTSQIDVSVVYSTSQLPLLAAIDGEGQGISNHIPAKGQPHLFENRLYNDRLLLKAAEYGNDIIVRFLFATNWADANTKDDRGNTPLLLAASRGHVEVVKLLLATSNVNVDAKNAQGNTPLSLATLNGQVEVIELLLATSKVDVNAKDANGNTPLSLAVLNGQGQVIHSLLATSKVDVDVKDAQGNTPLSLAVLAGEVEIVKLLLATNKVDLDVKNAEGNTPLLLAASEPAEFMFVDFVEVIKLLLATNQVDVNMKDAKGRTPLLVAAMRGNIEVVKFLLATGQVDVDVEDSEGRTPLFRAACKGEVEIVELLLETGQVDVSQQFWNGQSPVTMAEEVIEGSILKFIRT